MLIFAEIADKMPTLGGMWEFWMLVGLFVASVTAGLSQVRWWLGAAAVGLSLVIGLVAASPDRIVDVAVVQELGAGYLLQQRLSAFVPCVLAVTAWATMYLVRRSRCHAAGVRPGMPCPGANRPSSDNDFCIRP